jgi:hypothetical protein
VLTSEPKKFFGWHHHQRDIYYSGEPTKNASFVGDDSYDSDECSNKAKEENRGKNEGQTEHESIRIFLQSGSSVKFNDPKDNGYRGEQRCYSVHHGELYLLN